MILIAYNTPQSYGIRRLLLKGGKILSVHWRIAEQKAESETGLGKAKRLKCALRVAVRGTQATLQ